VLSIAQQIVSREIDQALTRHHVAANSRIRAEVQARVDWDSVSVSSVSVCDENNRVMTLDAYLAELRLNPEYSSDFPPAPRQVSRGDIDKLREHFNDIRAGSVVVVD
jgi:hypothetical protein